MKLYSKKLIYVFLFFISLNGYGQNVENAENWFIVLPLRFTHLQNNNTMLSGIKLGRTINDQLHTSISVYHSFYLNSFKAQADIVGFDKQPRLFINCVGGEIEYRFFNSDKVSSGLQLLIGWGFLKYDLKDQNFNSKQVNYLAIEPTISTEFRISNTTCIGLGIGYRPILSNQKIAYSSDLSDGEIPVSKSLPNGINIIFTLKGLF